MVTLVKIECQCVCHNYHNLYDDLGVTVMDKFTSESLTYRQLCIYKSLPLPAHDVWYSDLNFNREHYPLQYTMQYVSQI